MASGRARRRSRPPVTTRRELPMAMIIGIVVLVLFAGAVGFGVYRAQQVQGDDLAVPPDATAVGVPIGQPDAPATVDIYLDFQCPACRSYEQMAGDTIDEFVSGNVARVVYHPVAYLDRFSTTQYSSRSSAASGCAAEAGVFPEYLELLYANQPPEGGDGLPAEQLIALGMQAGAGPEFAECIAEDRYAGWTASVTDAASRAGVTATPTILVDGQEIARTGEALRSAVEAAR